MFPFFRLHFSAFRLGVAAHPLALGFPSFSFCSDKAKRQKNEGRKILHRCVLSFSDVSHTFPTETSFNTVQWVAHESHELTRIQIVPVRFVLFVRFVGSLSMNLNPRVRLPVGPGKMDSRTEWRADLAGPARAGVMDGMVEMISYT